MKNYDPTEAEIRKACAEIQAGWSEVERERRARHMIDNFGNVVTSPSPPAWEPKLVCLADLDA